MTSWTLDFCSRKSGCYESNPLAQQSIKSTEHCFGLLHSKWSPCFYSPHSRRTCLMPFSLPASDVGWSARNTIGWSIQHPFQMNQPSHSFGTAPPGFKFILEANRASLVHAAWPCELLTISKALYSGPCNHSDSGMIFSQSCMKFGSLRKDFELWNCIPVSQMVLHSNTHHNFFNTQEWHLLLWASHKSSKLHYFGEVLFPPLFSSMVALHPAPTLPFLHHWLVLLPHHVSPKLIFSPQASIVYRFLSQPCQFCIQPFKISILAWQVRNASASNPKHQVNLPIEIYCFPILHVMETFMMQLMMSSGEWNTLSNLHVNLWK